MSPKNHHLTQGALLVDRVHHLNVEGRRLIESAHRVIKQDVGVFEEPGDNEQCQGNADQPRFACHEEQEGEDHDDRRGPAARGPEEVMQQVQVARRIGDSINRAHYCANDKTFDGR